MVVAVALTASFCYAVAIVLQQRTASEADPGASLRLRLLGDLARRPAWLLGIALNGAGYGLRFIALSRESLVLVQPLLVCALLFALPLAAATGGRRLRGREWAGGAAIVAGLSAFEIAADPSRGRSAASAGAWAVLAVAAGIPVLMALGASRRLRPASAVPLLAGSAGVVFAVAAALMKVTGADLGRGLGHAVVSPAPYALVAVGLLGMVVVQSAFQAGPLGASLPVLSVVEPLASISIGRLLLGEHLAASVTRAAVEVVGLLLMSAGVVAATTSPVLRAAP